MDFAKQLLNLPDEVFLNFEKREQPMHVAGLLLFDIPVGAGEEYVCEQVERLRSFNDPKGIFSKRVLRKLGKAYWETDPGFDLEHHLRYHALPSPGRIRELLSFVSAEHSNLMDRHRPLWEYHVIERLPNQQFAVYIKLHHAMTDGLSAMRMVNESLSPSSDVIDLSPIWAMDACGADSQSNPSSLNQIRKLMNSTRKHLFSLNRVSKEVYSRLATPDPDISFQGAPRTMFNRAITGSRRYAAQSYSLSRIKSLSKSFECTLNDIVLVICSSALRKYLISQNALPDKPLIAAVPVSLRSEGSVGGNQVGVVLANLGTHIADPEVRFAHVLRSIGKSKAHFKSLSSEEAQNYTTLMMLPTLFHIMTGMAPEWQAFNLVISNVPGPREPLYWNGARLRGMYPVSIAIDEMALNMTITSYCDSLEFGLTACRRSVPSMQKMLDYIEQAFVELENIRGDRAREQRVVGASAMAETA